MSSALSRWGEGGRKMEQAKNEKKTRSMAGLYNCNWNGIFTLTAIFTFPTDFHIFSYCPFMCFVCVRVRECVYRHGCRIDVATTFTMAAWLVNIINSENRVMQLLVMCLCYILYSVFWYHFTVCLILWLKNLSAKKWSARKNYVKKSHQIEEYVHMDVSRVQQQQIEVISRLKLNSWTYTWVFSSLLILSYVKYVPHMA